MTARVSVDDAIAHMQAAAAAPRRQTVPLSRAVDRVLAADLISPHDQPPFDASAMDGYAIAALPAEGSALCIIGESQAGRGFHGSVGPGEAVRIFTGAPVPAGATRVIVQENVVAMPGHIHLKAGVSPGGKPHIRPRGDDFAAGDVLLQAGDRLSPWRLAVAASAGFARLPVARRPVVQFVSTGDELVTPGKPARDDQIYEATSCALISLAKAWGASSRFAGQAGDDAAELAVRLNAMKADLIVTTGGASVGDFDLVREALRRLKARWIFETVNIRPGKPTGLAVLPDGRHILCLPGNPASTLICARLFLIPFVEAALGLKVASPIQRLPCAVPLPANGERETFIRAVILPGDQGQPVILPVMNDDSSNVRLFAIANGLIRRRAGDRAFSPGALCDCLIVNSE